jgi:hypothetical protein
MSEDRLSRKKSFVINNSHADLIVNDLLEGDFETLGRIFTDLVNYNLFGDESLTENASGDKADRSARRLLREDSENYITSWLAKSEQNEKNRKGGQEPTDEEIKDYARSKGYNEQIAIEWAITQAHNGWKDPSGEPIKYWKKTLDAYMRGVVRNMGNNIGKW